MQSVQLLGKEAAYHYFDPDTWEVFLRKGELLTLAQIDRLERLDLAETESQMHVIVVPPPPPPPIVSRVTPVARGRFKHPRAQAIIQPGNGDITVNGQPLWDFYSGTCQAVQDYLHHFFDLHEVQLVLTRMSVSVTVGSVPGISMRHAKAVVYSIARALISYDNRFISVFRKHSIAGMNPHAREED